MQKYLTLAKVSLQEYFVYRLNFYLWRFRNLISLLALVFFWLAIYGSRPSFLNYTKDQMLTYIVGIAFLRGLIFSSRTADLAGTIRNGDLNKWLLTPLSIFKSLLARDLSDKLLNTLFSFLEIFIVLKLFAFSFAGPTHLLTYLYFFVIVILAFFLYFFISITLSETGFWTEDIWATRWLFGIIFLDFFSGSIFPIDILPSQAVHLINLTPFPYLIFYPAKIWLEQISQAETLKAIFICFVWLIFFFWLSRFLFKKGLKHYEAYGG